MAWGQWAQAVAGSVEGGSGEADGREMLKECLAVGRLGVDPAEAWTYFWTYFPRRRLPGDQRK